MKSDDWRYPNFPKNRGAFSGLGRAKAQTLDGTDVPYLTKRPAPGVLALRKGDFLYVVGEQRPATPVTLQLYAVGRIGGDPRYPNTRLMRAKGLTGDFVDVAAAPFVKTPFAHPMYSPSGGWMQPIYDAAWPAGDYWVLVKDTEYEKVNLSPSATRNIAWQMTAHHAAHQFAQVHGYLGGQVLFSAFRGTEQLMFEFLSGDTARMDFADHVYAPGGQFEQIGTTQYAHQAFFGSSTTTPTHNDGSAPWYTSAAHFEGENYFAQGVLVSAGNRRVYCVRHTAEGRALHEITDRSTQNVVLAAFDRIGPGWLVAMTLDYRHHQAEPVRSGIAQLLQSVDAGKTWAVIPRESSPMFEPLYRTMNYVNSADASTAAALNARSNSLAGTTFYAAPLTADLAVVITNIPDSGVSSSGSPVLLSRVTVIGLWDRIAGTITQLESVTDSTRRAHRNRTIQPGLVALGDGVAIFTMAPEGASGWFYAPAKVRLIRRSDPNTIVDLGEMPLAPHLTGIPRAAGPNTIVCPMYADGAYRAYRGDLVRDPITGEAQSIDWAEIGVISNSTPAPETLNGMAFSGVVYGPADMPTLADEPFMTTLTDFTTLLPVRSDGNTTPGVPWASDSRIAAPE